MDFLPEDIAEYAEQFTAPESDLLAELNRYTHANVLMPRMLAGHLQGRVIAMLSKMIKPETVVEVGTYTGYSALCWAEGLTSGGKVHTIEVNDELEPKIRRFFDRSDYASTIELHIGNAAEVLNTLEGPFDIVFLDADKKNYPSYLDQVFSKVKVGGYIIADNVLWSGKVLDPKSNNDPDTLGLVEYAKKVHDHPHLENVLLPIRDGLLIARKIT